MQMTHTAPSPVDIAGRAAAPALSAWNRLARPQAAPVGFEPELTAALPEPARRWLSHSVSPGTPLARAAIVEMEGHIRIGRWLPFRAVQLHAPPQGYVWAARARLGPISVSGFDRYDGARGEMRWRLLGMIPVMTARGLDVDRSAAGRVALDALLVPTAFLDEAVTWREGPSSDAAVAEWRVGAESFVLELRIGANGALQSVVMNRWANPNGLPWGEYPCGGTLADETDFGGVRLATKMRAGYFFGTDRWDEGEFFRAEITNVTFI
jgi:hypothetical protein